MRKNDSSCRNRIWYGSSLVGAPSSSVVISNSTAGWESEARICSLVGWNISVHSIHEDRDSTLHGAVGPQLEDWVVTLVLRLLVLLDLRTGVEQGLPDLE